MATIKLRSVDEVLVNAGFVKTSVLAIKGENGVDLTPYFRSYTSLGDICYIEIDPTEGINMATTNGIDRMRATVRTGSTIKQQTMISVAQCANSAVCGVAFECDSEVCVLVPTSHTETGFREQVYVVTEALPSKNVQLHGTPLAYPVIRLSEILSCPEAAIKKVNEASRIIAARTIGLAQTSMTELASRATCLSKSLGLLTSHWDTIHRNRCKEIDELHKLREYYACIRPPTCESMETEKKIVAELCARGHALEAYLALQARIVGLLPELGRMQAQVEHLYAHSYLASREPTSCALRTPPQAWGYPQDLDRFHADLVSGKWPCEVDTGIHKYTCECPEAAKRLEHLKAAVNQ